MKEIWKPINILGALNYYEVSNLGRVRSLERVVIRSNGRPHRIRERILKQAIDPNGYYRCGLSMNKKLYTYKVHRLVADAFCKKYLTKKEVNHINGNKKDNRAINLEWVNRSENVKHSYNNGLQKPMRGEINPTAKIKETQALEIKKRIKNKEKLKSISREMKVSYNIVKDISRNRTWKHLIV